MYILPPTPTVTFKGFKLAVSIKSYPAYPYNTAISLIDTEDGAPFAVATINIDTPLDNDLVAIKSYSENAGILEALIAAKLISAPIYYIQQGTFIQVPVCTLLTNPLREH